MIAGGSGVVPMIQVARGIVFNEKDDTLVHLLYSERAIEDIILRQDIDFLADYWNFTRSYFITRVTPFFFFFSSPVLTFLPPFHQASEEDKGTKQRSYMVLGRRIQDADMKEHQKGPLDKILVLVCGTREFNASILASLLTLGFLKENIIIFD